MPKGSGGRGASSKQKWIPKGSEKQAGKKGKENEDISGQAGPKYDRNQLLKTYRTCKNGGALLVAQEANSVGEAQELRYSLEARPEEEGTNRKGSKDKVDFAEERRPSELQLVQELVTEGAAASAPADPAMLTYLQSMVMSSALYGMSYPGYTTVMLRNIPNRYTRDMLIRRLDKGYQGLYDFVYLPIDFSSRCNVGYAFINFRTPAGAQRFMQEFHGAKTKLCLPGFGSAKVAEVSFARVQGRQQNMENLRDEKFIEKLNDRPDWQPLFLDDEGKEIPFSKTFGGVPTGEKRRNSKKMAAPPYIPPSTPTGFMKPMPYFPAPTSFPAIPPAPAPPSIFASLLPSASQETLFMLRGVPLSYTRQQLVDFLKRKFDSEFDFVFLPEKPDAQSEGPCNRGFAFVNFKSVEKATEFKEDFSGKQATEVFPETESDKACEVVAARMENLEKSIDRCQKLALQKNDEENAWLPILIGDDGEVKKFPMIAAEEKENAADDANAGGTPANKDEAGPKSKAKPNRKGSKDGTPTGAAVGFPYPFGAGYPGYYGGYQGYPAYPGYNPYQVYSQMAAAQNARAIQAAQVQARAKAGRKGGEKGLQTHHNVLEPLAAAVNMKGDEQLSEDSKDGLRRQVEFYFSTNNLCKDLFLRQHMDPEGWTSLTLIAEFPMVRRFKVSLKTLIEVVSGSSIFEIDEDKQKLRLADEGERKKWAQAPVPLEYKVPA